uniref:Uncharacterized protein n=1 Tax=Siphoviridae sp. ctxzZ3 TaxID=2826523 RepID=A0A8S5NEU3_9CAUD|nr:MAG TPA: hypothetical protein [Siphoviridae sp. ctxzZ3]
MLNKEKYNLRQIDISTKTKDGKILFFELKIRGKTIYQQIYPCGVFACDAMEGMIGWLEEEYKPKILTDKEKAYLSALIKPFRNNVKFIRKMRSIAKEFILIELKCNVFSLPFFEAETMYKGMEVNKKYTLEELGL